MSDSPKSKRTRDPVAAATMEAGETPPPSEVAPTMPPQGGENPPDLPTIDPTVGVALTTAAEGEPVAVVLTQPKDASVEMEELAKQLSQLPDAASHGEWTRAMALEASSPAGWLPEIPASAVAPDAVPLPPATVKVRRHVRITHGTYQHERLVRAGETVEVEGEEAERLVALKVAEIVTP